MENGAIRETPKLLRDMEIHGLLLKLFLQHEPANIGDISTTVAFHLFRDLLENHILSHVHTTQVDL